MGVLLSTTNLADADAASVTCLSVAAGMDVASLLTPPLYDVWRSASWGASAVDIDVDLGASAAVNVVAIGAPRDGYLPTASCTLRLTASTSSQAGTDALDTGTAAFTLSPWGVWGWRSVAGITAQYLRLRLTGTVADDYVQLGRLWVGPATITARSFAYNSARTATDPGTVTRASPTGARYAAVGRPYRVETIRMPLLTTAEGDIIEAAAIASGTTRQVFAARLDTELGSGIFGAFRPPPTVARTSKNFSSADLQIEEDG